MNRRAFTGADIFDGDILHQGKAIVLEDTVFHSIVAQKDIPADCGVKVLDGGTILPGFVDLQVNGGGGIMFNDETTVDGLKIMSEAHARTGTRALLPTLITDTPERTHAAVDAVEEAIEQGIPGIIGLHLEGPHLSVERKGAHDPALIRPMNDKDETFLLQTARRIPNVMLTLAPENVRIDQIERLAEAGIIVSLGHSDCSFDQAMAAFAAGASCVTHLFNAMSQLENREPGLVGAALDASDVCAGLISDGIHVHANTMRTALSAKRGPGRIFLVTDAMATAGSEITEFSLNGRTVLRKDNRLTLESGTLAGADLDFPTALSLMINTVGLSKREAFAMATSTPQSLLTHSKGIGHFVSGHPANGILLNDDFMYCGAL
ncbi:MAG: N-acetylglucosamine-6-phosphate deacetylase [Roseobacter sp.]